MPDAAPEDSKGTQDGEAAAAGAPEVGWGLGGRGDGVQGCVLRRQRGVASG